MFLEKKRKIELNKTDQLITPGLGKFEPIKNLIKNLYGELELLQGQKNQI